MVKKYKFFTAEIFGIDKTLERLVEEYFHSAAKRLDVRKRILLLMGPVSGGKSRFQIRIHFSGPLSDYDGSKDGWEYLQSNAVLNITYTK